MRGGDRQDRDAIGRITDPLARDGDNVSDTICSFEDVLLDWAIAEVLSPIGWHEYYSRLGDEFRQRVATTRAERLSAADRDLLLRGVQYAREPLIVDECGITGSWTFWRSSINPAAMSGYSILQSYRDRYGDIVLGELAVALRDRPAAVDEPTRTSLLAMIGLSGRGVQFNGRPIAVLRPETSGPLLIEGYKRAMAALLSGTQSIELYFCSP
jgi:hypothetical protein